MARMMKKILGLIVFLFLFSQVTAGQALAVRNISDNATGGDCTTIGTWDPGTKTCTLTTDLSEGIVVQGDNIILDGDGHIITGTLLNSGNGIYLRNRTGVTIKNLNIKFFNHEISVWYSNNNKIENNTVEGSFTTWQANYGINLFSSHNNQITNNTVISNKSGGIMAMLSDNNSFLSNNCNGNNEGLRLYRTMNNVVMKNTFSNNNKGFVFQGGDLNNKIYNNNFINNTVQAEIGSAGNFFNLDKPTGGNYWSNYDTPAEGCIDSDSDNFCDSPYIPSALGQDNFPWTKQNGWLDQIAPTTIISLAGTEGNNGWYRSDVNVTLVASDNAGGSGVQKIEYSFDNSTWQTYTNPFTVNTQGTTTLYYRSVDNMNNIEETKTQEIKIDKTPPSVSGAATSSPNANGWYKDDVTVHFTCADETSGVESCMPDTTLSTEGADQNVNGSATDKAGNTANTVVGNINIDKTPPSISGAATSSPNTNGWYKDNVVIHFTAADDGSGIETVTSDQTITTEGANQSVTGEASDKAGNTASTTVSGINIDKNPPTITINIPNGSYILNQTVLADWAAIDGLSGLELSSGTVPSGSAINTSTPDTKEFSVTAKDKAGNEVTKTVQYKILYDFTGLLPPIKDGKEFKSGSTIPVKFQLKDVNGQFIASAVAKLYLIDSNGQEITPSGNANPGNLFRYDTSDNQYIYNLTTKGLSAGNWQLKIVLDDGSLKSFTIVLR